MSSIPRLHITETEAVSKLPQGQARQPNINSVHSTCLLKLMPAKLPACPGYMLCPDPNTVPRIHSCTEGYLNIGYLLHRACISSQNKKHSHTHSLRLHKGKERTLRAETRGNSSDFLNEQSDFKSTWTLQTWT